MYLRPRKQNSNKADFPKIGVYAGSAGMVGAAVLVLRTCYRMGAGYVYYYSIDSVSEVLSAVPEALQWDFNFNVDSLILGPGVKDLKIELLKKSVQSKKPLILDAGSFDCMIKNNFFSCHTNVVLTPHEGEMARLLDKDSSWVKENRKLSVEVLQKKTNACIVLKGSPTIVFDGKNYEEIENGNSALAKAGTGDVLAGILGTLLGHSSENLFEQVVDGISFHGKLASEWIKNHSIHSLTASDLVDLIHQIL